MTVIKNRRKIIEYAAKNKVRKEKGKQARYIDLDQLFERYRLDRLL